MILGDYILVSTPSTLMRSHIKEQFIEQRVFSRAEIAEIFGISADEMGEERPSWANAEEETLTAFAQKERRDDQA